jgi:hypothetical protein
MAGTVLTLSPRMPLDRAEQIVRARVERDGVAKLYAAASDGRQVAHLRRLFHRLDSDGGLDVSSGDRTDGTVCLTVWPAGQRAAGVWGDPKVD